MENTPSWNGITTDLVNPSLIGEKPIEISRTVLKEMRTCELLGIAELLQGDASVTGGTKGN
jgi:hypothetical protein